MTQQNWARPSQGGAPAHGWTTPPSWQQAPAPAWPPQQQPVWPAQQQSGWQPQWQTQPTPNWAPPTGQPAWQPQQTGWQAPPPGQFAPPPRRGNPLKTLLLALVILGALFFVGSVVAALLLPDTTTSSPAPDGTQTTGSSPTTTEPTTAPTDQTGPTTTTPEEEPYTPPPADMSPSELPSPQTYTEATRWMQANAVYGQSVTAPNACSFLTPVDAAKASTGELQAHIEDLTACLIKVWRQPVTEAGFELPRPPATVYTSPINTACGKLERVNASYCGGDQRIYYSVQIPRIFPSTLQHTPFLMDLVLAHEFGHTIQARTGIVISEMAWEQKVGKPEANVYSRRLEQQADCLAGLFTQAVGSSQGLSQADLANLNEITFNLGDDVLSGNPSIDSGHGSGKNRQKWFRTGLEGSTKIAQCNTFVVPASQVR